MIPKRFEDMEFSDIEALFNNKVPEGKTLEYKREISSNEKLLAGVSALANATGGDFIIGIEADKGIPTKLLGLKISDPDAEKARLTQIIQSSVEPRLPSLNIEIYQSPTGEDFILIRTKQSWIAPHRVKANDKFYGRNSVGKYPMDVSELRTAFMLTEQLSERIKNFRQERVQRIQTNEETPVSLIDGGKVILHLLPLASFTTLTEFDVMKLCREAQFESTSNSHESKINLEGIVIAPYFEKITTLYTQVFRNGCIERVICLNSLEGLREDDKDFSSRNDEEHIIKSLSDYIGFYSKLGIDLPIYLFLTLINVKDYKFHIDTDFRIIHEVRRKIIGDNKITFDRNNLVFPEIIINDYKQLPEEILRPTLNLVWNSVGLTRDFNYDEDGKWIENLRILNR
ncbi:MAG: ATP-binding protein [Acidobacteriota bacterium]|nr:ATP-binding protein [Acidobacteriota bacterium]